MTALLKPVMVEGSSGIPPEPDWSSIYSDVLDIALAHEEWGIVVREMQMAQILTVANGHAIGRLVHFRLQYRISLQQVAEKGAVVKPGKRRSEHGIRYNPHWGVMRQAAEAISDLESELGISPIRRASATKARKRATVERAADTYLRRTG